MKFFKNKFERPSSGDRSGKKRDRQADLLRTPRSIEELLEYYHSSADAIADAHTSSFERFGMNDKTEKTEEVLSGLLDKSTLRVDGFIEHYASFVEDFIPPEDQGLWERLKAQASTQKEYYVAPSDASSTAVEDAMKVGLDAFLWEKLKAQASTNRDYFVGIYDASSVNVSDAMSDVLAYLETYKRSSPGGGRASYSDEWPGGAPDAERARQMYEEFVRNMGGAAYRASGGDGRTGGSERSGRYTQDGRTHSSFTKEKAPEKPQYEHEIDAAVSELRASGASDKVIYGKLARRYHPDRAVARGEGAQDAGDRRPFQYLQSKLHL